MWRDWSIRGLSSNKYYKVRERLLPCAMSKRDKTRDRPVSPTMSSCTGIQELMAAETRASQIVAKARADRMKQAK